MPGASRRHAAIRRNGVRRARRREQLVDGVRPEPVRGRRAARRRGSAGVPGPSGHGRRPRGRRRRTRPAPCRRCGPRASRPREPRPARRAATGTTTSAMAPVSGRFVTTGVPHRRRPRRPPRPRSRRSPAPLSAGPSAPPSAPPSCSPGTPWPAPASAGPSLAATRAAVGSAVVLAGHALAGSGVRRAARRRRAAGRPWRCRSCSGPSSRVGADGAVNSSCKHRSPWRGGLSATAVTVRRTVDLRRPFGAAAVRSAPCPRATRRARGSGALPRWRHAAARRAVRGARLPRAARAVRRPARDACSTASRPG